MTQVRVIKLGTKCRDTATELSGTLTHWVINQAGHVMYFFQPRGLDDAGQPVKKIFLPADRLKTKEGDFETVDVPTEILGSDVEDSASGFKGKAVELIMHINGCFHIGIQPTGKSQKTNEAIDRYDFDLRQCIGEKIPRLTSEEKKKSTVQNPSPTLGISTRDRAIQTNKTTRMH